MWKTTFRMLIFCQFLTFLFLKTVIPYSIDYLNLVNLSKITYNRNDTQDFGYNEQLTFYPELETESTPREKKDKSSTIWSIFDYLTDLNDAENYEYNALTDANFNVTFKRNETQDFGYTIEKKAWFILDHLNETSYINDTKDVRNIEEKEIEKTLVIVWENCGLNNHLNISKITEFSLGEKDNLIVSYNPFIKSIIFETNTNNKQEKTHIFIQKNYNVQIFFFLFKSLGTVEVTLGCPKLNSERLFWRTAYIPLTNKIYQAKNAYSFNSLESASSMFKCTHLITILPGTVVRFNASLKKAGTLIFTFENSNKNKNTIYFFYFDHNYFQVVTSDHQKGFIFINETITDNFYLLFSPTGMQIYADCPYKRNSIGTWQVNFFEQKIQIETFLDFQTGNSLFDYSLKSFCALNDLSKIISNSSQAFETSNIRNTIKNLIKNINLADKFNTAFMPNQVQAGKLKEFFLLEKFSIENLMSPIHRVLIASRKNAQPGFFYKSITDYENGFSDGKDNFWIGLKTLNKVTNKYNYRLRIELRNGELVEEYKIFKVGDLISKYKIKIQYSDTNENSFLKHDDTEFSTYDFGPYSEMANYLNAGFWLKWGVDKNHLCFSCENGIESGISYSIYLSKRNETEFYYSYGDSSKIYGYIIKDIKMFLLP